MKRWFKSVRRTSTRRALRQGRPLRFESVEERRLMTAATGKSAPVDPIIAAAQADAQDGSISRSEMLGLFALVEANGKVSVSERRDLAAICDPASGFSMTDDVRDLARDVVGWNPANWHYQGHWLGNLKAGDSSAKLEKLVDKWFYGQDLPATDKFSHYAPISGSLFVNGPTYGDISQGFSGDCYLMVSLAELAVQDPVAIESMFIDNGDGTFAVRFYDHGTARYVTVNEELPVYYGQAEYASFNTGDGGNELWVALAEKAYCQINEEGWLGHGHKNSYKAINAGNPADTIAQITGDTTDFTPITAHSSSATLGTIVSDFQSGKTISFATKNHGTAANIVHDHCYAMIDYDSATQEVTLFNPWGLNNGTPFPGLVNVSWSAIVHSFAEWEVGDV